jgi:uncharacterized membrane protein YkvA (DUF1232 family)
MKDFVMAFEGWKAKARKLKQEVYALYLASRDRRVPWYARVVAIVVMAYAFSPIDLIPDPIPVLGYLDDLILIPLGIALVIKLIPAEVLQDCRGKAASAMRAGKPKNWVAGVIIILIWGGLLAFTFHFLIGFFTKS